MDLRVVYSCGWWAAIVLPLVITVRIAEASGILGTATCFN